ncbi:MAG: hypothetical protein ACK4GG_13615 [Sphingomonas sp.]
MSDQPLPQSSASAVFGYELYPRESALEVEVWPLSGTWSPFVVVVPVAERGLLNSVAVARRSERYLDAAIVRKVDVDAGSHAGFGLHQDVTPTVSARIFLSKTPSEVQFGEVGKPLHVLRFGDQ